MFAKKLIKKLHHLSMTAEQQASAIEEWAGGVKQSLKGKALDYLVEEFLGIFEEKARRGIREEIESLHRIKSFKKFRNRMLLSLFFMYYNGANSRYPFDPRKMVKEAARKADETERRRG